MKLFNSFIIALAPPLASLWLPFTQAEPVQYCKFDSKTAPGSEIDFCIGAQMYQNKTTSSHDLFVTMTLRRYGGSSRGWTAAGPGSLMQGSLMFIIYGDPASQEAPIVSIRTAAGHHQPTLLTYSDMPNGMDLRVISSAWLPGTSDLNQHADQDPNSYMARVSIICYSCQLWQGTDISATAKSQPWLWAWNADQEFDTFAFDTHLKMHKHHAGTGGWGNFYVDMKRTISTAEYPPSLPPIRPNVAALGTSDSPMTFSDSIKSLTVGPASFFHGLILAVTFLLLFPVGVVGLRIGSPRSYTYHWVSQLIGSAFLLIGLIFGILKSTKINTVHQWVGISLASVIGVQGLFGYWHHVRFLRLRRRTWVSHVHLWAGRAIMLAGWFNVVSGLLLRGYRRSSLIVLATSVLILVEAIGLTGWVSLIQRRAQRQIKYTAKPTWAREDDGTFALSSSDDEEDLDDENEGKEHLSEDSLGLMARDSSSSYGKS